MRGVGVLPARSPRGLLLGGLPLCRAPPEPAFRCPPGCRGAEGDRVAADLPHGFLRQPVPGSLDSQSRQSPAPAGSPPASAGKECRPPAPGPSPEVGGVGRAEGQALSRARPDPQGHQPPCQGLGVWGRALPMSSPGLEEAVAEPGPRCHDLDVHLVSASPCAECRCWEEVAPAVPCCRVLTAPSSGSRQCVRVMESRVPCPGLALLPAQSPRPARVSRGGSAALLLPTGRGIPVCSISGWSRVASPPPCQAPWQERASQGRSGQRRFKGRSGGEKRRSPIPVAAPTETQGPEQAPAPP